MNFSRVDEDTVRCFLTSEDLEENGLKLEDFFHNSEHAREFLQMIVERAKEEVGYEFDGGALAMQVSPLPENGLVITFSEKSDSFWKGLTEHLKDIFSTKENSEMTDFLDQSKNPQGENHSKLIENLLRGFIESRLEQAEKEETVVEKPIGKGKKVHKEEEEGQSELPELLLYRFEDLEHIEKFAGVVSEKPLIKSRVYYLSEQDAWFLMVQRGRTKEGAFRKFCAQALEYGTLISDNACQMEHLEEHGECIIAKDAIEVLKQLS